jgi:hypothetical protein
MTSRDRKATGVTWAAVRGDDPVKINRRAAHRDFKTTLGYIVMQYAYPSRRQVAIDRNEMIRRLERQVDPLDRPVFVRALEHTGFSVRVEPDSNRLALREAGVSPMKRHVLRGLLGGGKKAHDDEMGAREQHSSLAELSRERRRDAGHRDVPRIPGDALRASQRGKG